MAIKTTRGFTLTETMLTVALLAILALMMHKIFRVITKSTNDTTTRMEAVRNMQASAFQIERFTRNALPETIVISQESGAPVFSSLSFTNQEGAMLKIYQSDDKIKVDTTINSVTNTSEIQQEGLKRLIFIYPDPSKFNQIQFGITEQSRKNPAVICNYQKRLFFGSAQ